MSLKKNQVGAWLHCGQEVGWRRLVPRCRCGKLLDTNLQGTDGRVSTAFPQWQFPWPRRGRIGREYEHWVLIGKPTLQASKLGVFPGQAARGAAHFKRYPLKIWYLRWRKLICFILISYCWFVYWFILYRFILDSYIVSYWFVSYYHMCMLLLNL